MRTVQSKILKLMVIVLTAFLSGLMDCTVTAAPANFEEAKRELRQIDQDATTFYCGCDITWLKSSGTSGRVDHASCGYQIRPPVSDAVKARAARVEVEHLVPISWIGKQFQCGNRASCRSTSAAYNAAEADLHGLVPAIGQVNGDRSNFRFGMVSGPASQYGDCSFKVDFKQRIAEPADHLKGHIARVHFYYADRYNLRLSHQQQQLFAAWDRQFPVTQAERERDKKIAKVQGWSNPYISGEKRWGGSGSESSVNVKTVKPMTSSRTPDQIEGPVRGNRNSRIFHVKGKCPSFDRVAERNRVEFTSVSEAVAAGYRMAGNCQL